MKLSASSSLSKLSRLGLSRKSPNSRQPDSPHAESPKTFLETLADAIRAPTALFYKEHENQKGCDGRGDSPVSRSESPRKIPSSKKSVRFKPGKSIVDSEPTSRSSPIDIPNATPSLPPVEFATTPLLQCFGGALTEVIPTGRPRDPPVLESTVNFRQAMAEARDCLAEDGPSDVPPLRSQKQEALKDYSRWSSKGSAKASTSATKQDEPSQPLGLLNKLSLQNSNDTNEGILVASDERPCASQEASSIYTGRATCADSSPPGSERDLSHSSSAPPDENCDRHLSELHLEAESQPLKWMDRPTHEDIRRRFHHPNGSVSSDSIETNSLSAQTEGLQEENCARAILNPLPRAPADISPIQLSEPALRTLPASTSKGRKTSLQSSSEGDLSSSVLHFQNLPPWSAELVFRQRRRSSEELPGLQPRAGRLSSLTETMFSDTECAEFLPPQGAKVGDGSPTIQLM